MNSPYMGKFQVTQEFKGQSHDGLDLVGLDSKEIHCTVSGTVRYAGWKNSENHSQGFGLFVCIKGTNGNFYYFGHLSEIRVKAGDTVKTTDVISVKGNTGYSTRSHFHYCVRHQFSAGNALNISEISGIPAHFPNSKIQLKTAFSFMKGLLIIKYKEVFKNEEFYPMGRRKKSACEENC